MNTANGSLSITILGLPGPSGESPAWGQVSGLWSCFISSPHAPLWAPLQTDHSCTIHCPVNTSEKGRMPTWKKHSLLLVLSFS